MNKQWDIMMVVMNSKVTVKRKASPKKVTRRTNTRKRAATKKRRVKSSRPQSTAKTLSIKDVTNTVSRHPLGHMMVEHVLRDAGFKGEVTSSKTQLEKYSTDESIFHIKPQIVLQPKDKKDVTIAVSTLGQETSRFPSLSLTPRAAGTGLSGGSLTDSIVIDVSTFLNKIEEPKKSGQDVTITCEPGAMWRDVEKILKSHNHYLPSYPASKQICTIGGSVANNAAGPDSLRFGHTADWIKELEIVLHDGKSYKVRPWTYKEFRKVVKEKNALANIAKNIFSLIEKNENVIKRARPKTAKNSSGYALWDVLDTSVEKFKKGDGLLDLTQLIAGSQGTIGIITSVTLHTAPIAKDTELIAIPLFDLSKAGRVVEEALRFDPLNLEVFDALTFDAAMKNPQFFRSRLSSLDYYRVMLSMYTTYHVRWNRKLPELVLLISLQGNQADDTQKAIKALKTKGVSARVVTSPYEKEMFWQVRHAGYLLSKMLDPKKRPAAFLEDITVPPRHIAKFFSDIKYLLKKYHITAAVHGHGGNGHFHFYPLLDFTNKTTPALIMKMSEEFFNTAMKYDGNICGEHNDGIIRTPHLSKMYSKAALNLFKEVEHIFDPNDIFNPGKKVNPRFDIKSSIRETN